MGICDMSKPKTSGFRVKEERKTITILWPRFMCLRSIAEAVRTKDTERQQTLVKTLQNLEITEWMGLLEEGVT